MTRVALVLALLLTTGCRDCAVASTEVVDCGPPLRDQDPEEWSSECAWNGRCTPRLDRCVAKDDEDCRQSVICRDSGHCTMRARQCWRAAESHAECATPPYPGRAETCATYGFCQAVAGVCRATTDEHCAQSAYCRRGGQCSEVDGRCAPTPPRHCLESELCELFAFCSVTAEGCRAVGDGDCRWSATHCAATGRCTLSTAGCVATKPEHCEASDDCETLGWCTLDDGRCVAGAPELPPDRRVRQTEVH